MRNPIQVQADHSDISNVRSWNAKLGIFALALVAGCVAFQNCGRQRFEPMLIGGTGSDGLSNPPSPNPIPAPGPNPPGMNPVSLQYQSYGECGGSVEVTAIVRITGGAASYARQNCADLASPIAIANGAIQFVGPLAGGGTGVFLLNGQIFDLVNAQNQRTTLFVCVSADLAVAIWTTAETPTEFQGDLTTSANATTGVLPMLESGPDSFQSLGGGANSLALLVSSRSVQYSINQTTVTESGLNCLGQPYP